MQVRVSTHTQACLGAVVRFESQKTQMSFLGFFSLFLFLLCNLAHVLWTGMCQMVALPLVFQFSQTSVCKLDCRSRSGVGQALPTTHSGATVPGANGTEEASARGVLADFSPPFPGGTRHKWSHF